MLLDSPFTINNDLNNQLALNLVDICLDSTLQVLCKSLPYYVNIHKIDYSKIVFFWFLKFEMFNFKIVYFTQFLADFNYLGLKI